MYKNICFPPRDRRVHQQISEGKYDLNQCLKRATLSPKSQRNETELN